MTCELARSLFVIQLADRSMADIIFNQPDAVFNAENARYKIKRKRQYEVINVAQLAHLFSQLDKLVESSVLMLCYFANSNNNVIITSQLSECFHVLATIFVNFHVNLVYEGTNVTQENYQPHCLLPMYIKVYTDISVLYSCNISSDSECIMKNDRP